MLMVDSTTTVYSPVPLLIEAGSTQPDKPNAIVLSDGVLPSIESACGFGADGDAGRQVGLEVLGTAAMKAVKEDLDASPAKEFNVARIERVFNSALHFVELEILDYRLSAKKVTLDVELFGLGDDYLQERIENAFKPFDDAEFLSVDIPKLDAKGDDVASKTETFGPAAIQRERNQLKKEFLFDIPKFGVVIRRANKQEFEQRVRILEKKMKLYAEAVKKNIEGHLGKAKERLKHSLAERLSKNPPAAWKKFMDGDYLSLEEAGRLVEKALSRSFEGIADEFDPTIRWIYKDVTYETIHGIEFRKGLEKQFGKERAAKLFREYDAAPEKIEVPPGS